MMLMCKEVSRLVASGEVERLGRLKRLEYRLHLMMCRHCRAYERQIRAIGRAARETWSRLGGDAERLERLEARILAHLD